MTPCRNQTTVAQEVSFDVATELASRLKTRMTPENDPLLRGLEQDFLDLLTKSMHFNELIKAEEFLAKLLNAFGMLAYALSPSGAELSAVAIATAGSFGDLNLKEVRQIIRTSREFP